MKVFTDFDNTLRNHDGTDIVPQHERIKKHIEKGDKVTVITRRHEDDNHAGIDGEGVKQYVKEKLGDIPVIFDDSELKYKTLEDEEADVHYDDDPLELAAISKYTSINGIHVKDGKGADIKPEEKKEEPKQTNNVTPVNLKGKIALVYDTGLNIEFAIRLAKDFKKVYFFADYEGHQFENTNEMEVGLIGNGIDVIEKVYDFYAVKDQVDLFVFPDCKYAGMQKHLTSEGKRVWGGKDGIEYETERFNTKEKMKEMGMPIKRYWKIIGMENLKTFLKSHENVYIKTDVSRGDFESFNHKNYNLTEPRLHRIQSKIGPLADIYEFIIEEPVIADSDDEPVIEAGIDTFCIDGKYPENVMIGYEIKDSFYCGTSKKYSELSNLITDTCKAFSPLFKEETYRSFFSTETRIKKKVGYTIDLTCRIPSPPGDIYFHNIKNFSEVIWYGADGIVCEPIFEKKFSAEAIIHSSSCLSGEWEAIQFPKKYRDNVKLKNLYYDEKKDTYYSIPLYEGLGEIGSVLFCDDDFEKCIEGLKEIADSVKGTTIDIHVGDSEKAKKTILEGEKIGISFFK